MRRKIVFLTIAAVCLILAAAPCAAQTPPNTEGVKYFVNFGDIKGESTDKDHKDWIMILSHADGVSQGVNPAYSPLNTRSYMEPSFASIAITKFVDMASPKLMEAACKGTHIPEVVLEAYYNGSKFWMVTLEDVVVSSVQAQIPETLLACAVATDLPVETVSLTYGKIEWVYTQQKRKDGSGGGNVTAKYDLTKAKAAQ